MPRLWRRRVVLKHASPPKSAMYLAVEDAMTHRMWFPVLVKKIFAEIPGLRQIWHDKFLTFLGKGDWAEAEEFLKEKIGKILDP
jgi:hypothetical protein